jgi:hypothetical protein
VAGAFGPSIRRFPAFPALRHCKRGPVGLPLNPKVQDHFQSTRGSAMADHGEIQYSTAEGNDMPAHEAAYATFISIAKWGTGIVIVVLALMAYFLV